MQQQISNGELVMRSLPRTDRSAAEGERWSTPVSAMVVVGSSAVLWFGIFVIGRLLLG